ncbi:MAG: hypothetical protein V4665_00310 [Patescibacteria group bacterium]
MKAIKKARNSKAQIPLVMKGNKRMETVIKHPPDLKPKNKRAK